MTNRDLHNLARILLLVISSLFITTLAVIFFLLIKGGYGVYLEILGQQPAKIFLVIASSICTAFLSFLSWLFLWLIKEKL